MSGLGQVHPLTETAAPDPLPFAADDEVQEATGPWILEEQTKYEREEEGRTVKDVKRALRQNFRDTGVIDDVTVSKRMKDVCRPLCLSQIGQVVVYLVLLACIKGSPGHYSNTPVGTEYPCCCLC